MFAARTLFGGREDAAADRRSAERLEEVRGDGGAANPLGLAGAVRDRELVLAVGGDRPQHPAAVPEAHVQRVGPGDDRQPPLRLRAPEAHEAIGIRERQRPQQHRVDDAEDRDVGADADGQREERHHGEGGARAQGPHAVADVAPQAQEPAAARRRAEDTRRRRRGTLDHAQRPPEHVRRSELGERGRARGGGIEAVLESARRSDPRGAVPARGRCRRCARDRRRRRRGARAAPASSRDDWWRQALPGSRMRCTPATNSAHVRRCCSSTFWPSAVTR